jgi:hypothetical protein
MDDDVVHSSRYAVVPDGINKPTSRSKAGDDFGQESFAISVGAREMTRALRIPLCGAPPLHAIPSLEE